MENTLSTSSSLSTGLFNLLSPVVAECDMHIASVVDSQQRLNTQIEDLAKELDHFMTFSQPPPLAPHIQKLLNARNRLVSINTILVSMMGRLERISSSVNPSYKHPSAR